MNIEETILGLVSIESPNDTELITMESTLLGDLQIDGDDAWEVIEACHHKYKVDFTNFIFQNYFRNEPCFKSPLYYFRKYKYGDEHIASRKQPLTVAQLVKACEQGVWQIDV